MEINRIDTGFVKALVKEAVLKKIAGYMLAKAVIDANK